MRIIFINKFCRLNNHNAEFSLMYASSWTTLRSKSSDLLLKVEIWFMFTWCLMFLKTECNSCETVLNVFAYSFLISLCLCCLSKNTRSKGWIEVLRSHLSFNYDDNSLLLTTSINEWSFLMLKALMTLKHLINIDFKLREIMYDIRFINIVEKMYKWSINLWSENSWKKKLNNYTYLDLELRVKSLNIKFFTKKLNWMSFEIKILSALIKIELKCTEIHAYLNVWVDSFRVLMITDYLTATVMLFLNRSQDFKKHLVNTLCFVCSWSRCVN